MGLQREFNQITERITQALWGNMDIGRIIVGNPGLDSRMVKKIRLEEGLVYSINSFIAKYTKKGTLAFTTITSNENVEKVLSLMLQEIKYAKENFFTNEEISKAKNILKTQAILKMNDLSKHLKFLGSSSIGDKIFSLENEIRMIKNVQTR